MSPFQTASCCLEQREVRGVQQDWTQVHRCWQEDEGPVTRTRAAPRSKEGHLANSTRKQGPES